MTSQIHRSAHKHGAIDVDIGPDASANLLEVIAVTKDDDDELVIHAMALRRKYRALLQGLEAADD